MATDRQPAYDAVYRVIREHPPRSADDYGIAAENARIWRSVEAALDAERQRVAEVLAPLLAESRFLHEAAVSHSPGCDQAHAGCLAARVRELLDKISGDGGGE